MKRAIWFSLAALVATISLATVAASKGEPVPLKEASLIVEINSTDGDAGLQPSLDGDRGRGLWSIGPMAGCYSTFPLVVICASTG